MNKYLNEKFFLTKDYLNIFKIQMAEKSNLPLIPCSDEKNISINNANQRNNKINNFEEKKGNSKFS